MLSPSYFFIKLVKMQLLRGYEHKIYDDFFVYRDRTKKVIRLPVCFRRNRGGKFKLHITDKLYLMDDCYPMRR